MKKTFCVVFILLFSRQVFAQDDEADYTQIVKHAKTVVSLIINNKVNELAALIEYPLVREYPLPDINDKEKFIKYYKKYFGTDLIEAVKKIKVTKDNIIYVPSEESYGINRGELWFSEKGKIVAINVMPAKEKTLQDSLAENIRSKMHPSVTKWAYHVLDGKTDKVLIWVDDMPDGKSRYIAWNLPKKMSDKPDLIINDGTFHGTRWVSNYTFINKEWKYELEIDTITDEDDTKGYLTISKNGVEILTTKIKDTEK